MHHFITGAAGFIGSQLADVLVSTGASVSGVDDLSLGRTEFLERARESSNFQFFEADVSLQSDAHQAMLHSQRNFGSVDIVWHLAANSDIAAGNKNPEIDFAKTFLTTKATLEAAKKKWCESICICLDISSLWRK